MFFLATVCLGLSACASGHHRAGEIYDPAEPVNRAVFSFNEAVDKVLLKPVATGYNAIVPDPAKAGIRNFLRNLRSPVNIANQLLQGDIEGGSSDMMRALLNSTVGLGGLIDVADYFGLPYEREDFGQTLAVWGVGEGPYIVLPFLGPGNLRDHLGTSLDSYADPLRHYLHNTDQTEWHYARVGATVIDQRVQLLGTLEELKNSSFDYYAAIRSAHQQRRKGLIADDDPDTYAIPEIPDYDD